MNIETIREKDKVFYTHFDLGHGVITVAYQLDSDKDEVRAGFAFCSPTDNFCRQVGRELAEDRLAREPFFYWRGKDRILLPIVELAEEAFNTFVDKRWSKLPKWVKQVNDKDEWFLFIRARRTNRLKKRQANVKTRKNNKAGTTNC